MFTTKLNFVVQKQEGRGLGRDRETERESFTRNHNPQREVWRSFIKSTHEAAQETRWSGRGTLVLKTKLN